MRLRVRVSGRVQGVGYRASVHRRISRLNVVGYVKNMVDGSVELDVQGEKAEVEQALKEAWEGSPFSAVDSVDTEELAEPSGYGSFVIER